MNLSLSKLRELVMDREGPGVLRFIGSQRTERLNWTELNWNTPRIKLVAEAELCWHKDIRWPLLRSRKISMSAHAHKGSLGVKKGRVPHHNKFGHILTGFCSGIHLSKKLHMHLGKRLRTDQVWKKTKTKTKNQHNWPKVNKDPEGLFYIRDLNHLFTVLLLIREDSHTLSLWVCISA